MNADLKSSNEASVRAHAGAIRDASECRCGCAESLASSTGAPWQRLRGCEPGRLARSVATVGEALVELRRVELCISHPRRSACMCLRLCEGVGASGTAAPSRCCANDHCMLYSSLQALLRVTAGGRCSNAQCIAAAHDIESICAITPALANKAAGCAHLVDTARRRHCREEHRLHARHNRG